MDPPSFLSLQLLETLLNLQDMVKRRRHINAQILWDFFGSHGCCYKHDVSSKEHKSVKCAAYIVTDQCEQ
eukprot:1036604-Amphidinium_carterae.1